MDRRSLGMVMAVGLFFLVCITAAAAMDNVRELKSKGICYQQHGMLAKAIAEYQKALQENPEDAASHNNIGLALKDMGLLADAEAELHAAIDIRPDKPNYHYNLAIVLIRLSDLHGAEKEFYRALKLKPDDPEVHYQLANVLMLEGKNKDARKSIETAVEFQPQNPIYLQLLGDVFLRQISTTEALVAYRKASALSRHPEPQLINKIEFATNLLSSQKGAITQAATIGRGL